MRRVLLNFLTLASLAVSVAAVVLLVRSYRFSQSQTGESLRFTRRDPQWWVPLIVLAGGLMVLHWIQ